MVFFNSTWGSQSSILDSSTFYTPKTKLQKKRYLADFERVFWPKIQKTPATGFTFLTFLCPETCDPTIHELTSDNADQSRFLVNIQIWMSFF